jgi:hypothetical protein
MYAAVRHASPHGGESWKLSDQGLELKSVPNESGKRVWNIRPARWMNRASSTPEPIQARCSGAETGARLARKYCL